MNRKLMFLIVSALLSLSVLSACNLDNNNDMVDPEDVNYEPVRYDRNNDRGIDDMRGNYLDNEGTDLNNRNNDLDNGGLDLDTDPRNVRDREEVDTPFNMDEEEPDLDEEPSEERRGQ
ncbi:hypothetical protein [Bacillus taeanensis]|uniref:DNA primase n=1 Tax=Bacillus taeanensis TaxID=273032 RepID=A0A366XW06_9BACI|nr:hypothetical protein [Bacillus taeanensis]RBW68323.1 hypothetical protein DS031_17545 [Bacillus taeanensis]